MRAFRDHKTTASVTWVVGMILGLAVFSLSASEHGAKSDEKHPAPPAAKPSKAEEPDSTPPAAKPAKPTKPETDHSTPAAKEPEETPALAPKDPPVDQTEIHEAKVELAKRQRSEKDHKGAEMTLAALMKFQLSPAVEKKAILEMALNAEESQQYTKAVNILSEYRRRFPDDVNGPDILLKQGLIYRSMGANTLALSKFYSVMTSSLSVKASRIEHYQKLVVRAQMEIADTYYLEGKYAESADFLGRILKLENPDIDRAQISYKQIRSLYYLNRYTESVAQCQGFLNRFPQSGEVPEVRFLLADGLKKLGQNREAMQQVLLLLESQQSAAATQPQTWVYWQQRTGNEIANQLYKEGDYINALEIYLNLARLDNSPSWQWPVLYQVGLVYEHLKQPEKAGQTFKQIADREKELGTNAAPSLVALVDMAKWRRKHLSWQSAAEEANRNLNPGAVPIETAVLKQ